MNDPTGMADSVDGSYMKRAIFITAVIMDGGALSLNKEVLC